MRSGQITHSAGSLHSRPVLPRMTLLILTLLTVSACSTATATVTTASLPEPTTTTTAAPTTTTSTTSTTSTTTTVPTGPVSPLNGEPVEDETVAEQRVIAVKIDNHWNARPQSGIQQADAVYELLVEAGLTRFIALFHESDSDYLGPMRSGRPTDPTLLKPLGATFAISGAQDWVISRIVRSGVDIIGEVRPATFRISGRYAPHNLYVDTTLLRDYADSSGYSDEAPPDLFTWGEWTDGGQPAEEIEFDWSDGLRVRWEWNGTDYARFTGGEPHRWVDEQGETGQIAAETLVVLFARRYTAVPPSSGSSVPAMDTVGRGRALVFHGGTVREGEWSRDSIDEPFVLADSSGDLLTVPAGRPWVSVFPNSRSVSW